MLVGLLLCGAALVLIAIIETSVLVTKRRLRPKLPKAQVRR